MPLPRNCISLPFNFHFYANPWRARQPPPTTTTIIIIISSSFHSSIIVRYRDISPVSYRKGIIFSSIAGAGKIQSLISLLPYRRDGQRNNAGIPPLLERNRQFARVVSRGSFSRRERRSPPLRGWKRNSDSSFDFRIVSAILEPQFRREKKLLLLSTPFLVSILAKFIPTHFLSLFVKKKRNSRPRGGGKKKGSSDRRDATSDK